MQLETVSKIKGCVALLGWSVVLLLPLFMNERNPSSGEILLGGFAGWVGIIYSIKWFRLRGRMRMAEYQGRIVKRG
jgi:hypothetical protein